MKLTRNNYVYISLCLESFIFGEIPAVLQLSRHLSKRDSNLPLVPGLYSGIFVMYLQYHAAKKRSNNVKENTIFYALCVVYALSMAIMALDIAVSVTTAFVSNYIFFFNFVLIRVVQRLFITIQPIAFACCDFITQSILVCTTRQCPSIQFIHLIFKDTPLLYSVVPKYPHCDHSFNFSICILRSVNLP